MKAFIESLLMYTTTNEMSLFNRMSNVLSLFVTATYNLSRKPKNATKKLFRISISLIYKHFFTKSVLKRFKACQKMVLQLHQIWRQPNCMSNITSALSSPSRPCCNSFCDLWPFATLLWQFCNTSLKYFAPNFTNMFCKIFHKFAQQLATHCRPATLQHFAR